MHARAFGISSAIGKVSFQALAICVGLLALPAGARAGDSLGQFIAALDAEDDDGSAFFNRLFGAKSARRDPIALATTKNNSSRFIIVADADPNFERWQRSANERLKQEQAGTMPKQHPLATAHPAKSVVVCEAGCGMSTKDEIVYLAPVVPAVLPASANNDAADPAAKNLADGELPCIAGCYVYATEARAAGRGDQSRLNDNDVRDGLDENAFVLTATSPRTQPDDGGKAREPKVKSPKVKATSAADFYDGWRTKIMFSRTDRGELPGRAWQRQGVSHDRILMSENPNVAQ